MRVNPAVLRIAAALLALPSAAAAGQPAAAFSEKDDAGEERALLARIGADTPDTVVSAHHAVPMAQGSRAARSPDNPFARFFGEWTLKDDRFQQVWDGKTVETLTIPNHHTRCAPLNTVRSVLCVVTTPDLAGHILWTYDDSRKEVHHLSHSGTARNGVGVGSLSERADLTTRVSFSDEAAGSYRIYVYKWQSDDEYSMMSRQFDRGGEPSGNWYGGVFVRVKPAAP